MKSLIFIFVFFLSLLFCSGKNGEWKLVDSTLNSTVYMSVKCQDSDDCIAIGNNGLVAPIIKISSDKGYTWKTVLWDLQGFRYDSAGNKYFYFPPRASDVAYRKNIIFAIGDTGCYWLSRDNGVNWKTGKLQSLWGNDLVEYYRVDMFDENFGAVTCPIDLFITTDGWKSHKKIEFNLPDSLMPQAFEDISCPDSNTIILSAYKTGRDDYIIRSDDRGLTWNAYSKIPYRGLRIFFLDKNNGYAIGYNKINSNVYKDIIHHTTDGGKTWVTQLDTIEYQNHGLNDIHFIDSLNGIAVGYWYKLWRTTNGGITWIKDTSYNNKVGDGYFSDVVMLSATDYIGVTNMSGKIFRYTGDWTSVNEHHFTEKNDKIMNYPNPAGEYIEINLDRCPTLSKCRTSEIRIYNVLGECVKEIPPTPLLQRGTIRIDVSGLPAGVYFVRIGEWTGKFVKSTK